MLGRKLIQVAIASFVLFSMLALQCPGKTTPPATDNGNQEASEKPLADQEWDAKLDFSWEHMTGFSFLCWLLDTDPVPGAPYKVTASGTGLDDEAEQTGSLDNAGRANGKFRIVQFGDYSLKASVTSDGETKEDSVTATVKAGAAPKACGA